MNTITLTEEEQTLVQEYNTLSHLNSFLYSNKSANQWLQENKGFERTGMIIRCNQISRKLLELLQRYDGKECQATNTTGISRGTFKGKIKLPLTREYDGRIIHNDISFRRDDENEQLLRNGKSITEVLDTIVFNVEVENNVYASHLYTIDQISLL